MHNPAQISGRASLERPPKWRIFAVLTLPIILIFLLITLFIVFYSALGHELTNANAFVSEYIAVFFILNHVIAFGALMWFIRKDRLWLSDIGFRLPDNGVKGLILEITIAILTTLIVIGFLTLILPLFEAFQADTPNIVRGDKKLGNIFLLTLFASVCVASFVEETIYRGYGITVLSRHWGILSAIIISSIFFGLFHISYGIVGVIRTTFQGLVFALLFTRSKSLLGPIVAHSSTNLIATLWAFDVI